MAQEKLASIQLIEEALEKLRGSAYSQGVTDGRSQVYQEVEKKNSEIRVLSSELNQLREVNIFTKNEQKWICSKYHPSIVFLTKRQDGLDCPLCLIKGLVKGITNIIGE